MAKGSGAKKKTGAAKRAAKRKAIKGVTISPTTSVRLYAQATGYLDHQRTLR